MDQLVVKLSVILTSRLTVKISVIDWLTIKQTLINLSVVKITVVDVTCNKIIHIVEKDCLFDLFVGKFALWSGVPSLICYHYLIVVEKDFPYRYFGRDRLPIFTFRFIWKIPFYVLLAVYISVAVNTLHIDSSPKSRLPNHIYILVSNIITLTDLW